MKIYLAHNIKTLRKAHYMSQAELAKKMEVHSLICDSVFIEEFLEYHKQKEMQFKTGGGAPSEN